MRELNITLKKEKSSSSLLVIDERYKNLRKKNIIGLTRQPESQNTEKQIAFILK